MRTAALSTRDVVLEVGPGLGSLTLGLLDVGVRTVAVELDPLLAEALPATVAARAPSAAGLLTVLRADALRLPGPDVAGARPTVLVANLPYNVAVPLVLHLLDVLPSVARGLVMMQAEVAQRLAAPPGSRVYGVPSVKAAWYAEVRRAGTIPRAVFWPVPNVDSELVAFTRRPPPQGNRTATFAVIDAAFSSRRKSLRAALAGWAGGVTESEAALRRAGVDPGLRGEALEVGAFAAIAAARMTQ